jgi:hypothetical protein
MPAHKFTVSGILSNLEFRDGFYGKEASFTLKSDPVQIEYAGQVVPHDGEFRYMSYKCQTPNGYTDENGFPKYIKEGGHVLVDGIIDGYPKKPEKIKDPATESRYGFTVKAKQITAYGRTMPMPMNLISGCGQVEAAVHSEHGGVMMLMKEKKDKNPKKPDAPRGERFYMVWSPFDLGEPSDLAGKYLTYQGKMVKDLHPNSLSFGFSHRDRQPFVKAEVIGG